MNEKDFVAVNNPRSFCGVFGPLEFVSSRVRRDAIVACMLSEGGNGLLVVLNCGLTIDLPRKGNDELAAFAGPSTGCAAS